MSKSSSTVIEPNGSRARASELADVWHGSGSILSFLKSHTEMEFMSEDRARKMTDGEKK